MIFCTASRRRLAAGGGVDPQGLRPAPLSKRPRPPGRFTCRDLAESGRLQLHTLAGAARFPGGPGAAVRFTLQYWRVAEDLRPTPLQVRSVFETAPARLSGSPPLYWWSRWNSNPPRLPCKGCLRPAPTPYFYSTLVLTGGLEPHLSPATTERITINPSSGRTRCPDRDNSASRRPRRRKMPRSGKWYEQRDLNPHGLSTNDPSSRCGYQLRHARSRSWCPTPVSNRDARRQRYLKPPRLPIPPDGRTGS